MSAKIYRFPRAIAGASQRRGSTCVDSADARGRESRASKQPRQPGPLGAYRDVHAGVASPHRVTGRAFWPGAIAVIALFAMAAYALYWLASQFLDD